jgi:thiamine biosynthesis lipoprotein
MGTDAHVLVVGTEEDAVLTEWAQRRLEQLEARWSRFRADSELTALNQAEGQPRLVSADTTRVIAEAIAAWRATDGRFDPTVGAAIVASGYDESFATLAPRPTLPDPRGAGPSPGCEGIEVDLRHGLVRLPPGVRLDLGGIAKGTAADVVAAELLERGAAGACVNVGGDLRVIGANPDPEGWKIDLAPPGLRPDSSPATSHLPSPAASRHGGYTVALRQGAVATSSTLDRRWATVDGDRHHVIDPETGDSTASGLHSVSVIAGGAAQAEVIATTMLVAGEVAGRRLVEELELAALLVRDDGTICTAGRLGEFLR